MILLQRLCPKNNTHTHTHTHTLTRLIIYLREDVLDGFVIVLALGLGVRWRVTPLPAPLHHLSGLRRSEGLQARRAVQHVLDNPLHCHCSLELQQNMPDDVMQTYIWSKSPEICKVTQINMLWLVRLGVHTVPCSLSSPVIAPYNDELWVPSPLM